MKCPECGQDMVTEVREETLCYGGESITLTGMQGQFCSACDEGVWDNQSYQRYTEAQTTLLHAVRKDFSSDSSPSEPIKRKSLLGLLSKSAPSDEDFPNIDIGLLTLDDVEL